MSLFQIAKDCIRWGYLSILFILNVSAGPVLTFGASSAPILMPSSGGMGDSKLCEGIGVDLSTCPGICPMPMGCANHPCRPGYTYFNGAYSPVTSGCLDCVTGEWTAPIAACVTPTPSPGPSVSPTPDCKPPEQDEGSGGCKFFSDRHRCDDGSGSGLGSSVSLEVGGVDRATRFKNAVNKKLACCLNRFSTGDSYSKFDCIENSKDGYADFNQLWASSDPSAEGGEMNALVLVNAIGVPISGFYTAENVRCVEFSEFSGELQPVRINGETMELVGSPIPLPNSNGYSEMKARVIAKGARIPTTLAERRRCPILVRAAIVAQCPSNPVPPASPRTYTDPATQKRRCATMSSVQVQIRIEQLTEITNIPKMQPVDTIIDSKNASAISIERVIANKYGNQCPPGSHRLGETCVED